VTPEVFLAVNDAVDRVLNEQHLTWLVLAVLLAFWESPDRCARAGRPEPHLPGRRAALDLARFGLSFLLALAVIVLLLGALGLVAFGGTVFRPPAMAMAWVTIAMLIRFAPADRVQFRWVSVGSVLVVASWVGASLLYGVYVRNVADFESTFGFFVAGLLLYGLPVRVIDRLPRGRADRRAAAGGPQGRKG
jgi:hypothetical protein